MRNLEKDWSEYDDGYDDDEYWEEEEWAAHAAAQPPAPAPAPAPSPIDECVRALKAMLGEEFSAAQLQAAAQRHSANFDLALNELLASRASQPNGRPGAPPQAEERRYDAGNGVLSTKEEFIEEYGGTAEWDAAYPWDESMGYSYWEGYYEGDEAEPSPMEASVPPAAPSPKRPKSPKTPKAKATAKASKGKSGKSGSKPASNSKPNAKPKGGKPAAKGKAAAKKGTNKVKHGDAIA